MPYVNFRNGLSRCEMEFQNQPFQDLKERVQLLEERVEELVALIEPKTPTVLWTPPEPQAVREKQDDAGGKPLFKTVEKVPKENEGGG